MGRKIPAPILIMPEEPGGPRGVASGGSCVREGYTTLGVSVSATSLTSAVQN